MTKKTFLFICNDEDLIRTVCLGIASYCKLENIQCKVEICHDGSKTGSETYDAVLLDDGKYIRMSASRPFEDNQELLKPFNMSMLGHALQALFGSNEPSTLQS